MKKRIIIVIFIFVAVQSCGCAGYSPGNQNTLLAETGDAIIRPNTNVIPINTNTSDTDKETQNSLSCLEKIEFFTENVSPVDCLEENDNLRNSVEDELIGENDFKEKQWIDTDLILCDAPADVIVEQYYNFVCQINTSNLFEADIADLDGDGKPELVIITEIPGGKPEYGHYSDISIEIYKLINGNVVLLDSILSDTERWYDFAYIKSGEIYLSSFNGKDYICFDNDWSHQGGGTSTLFFLAPGDDNKLSVEFSYCMDIHEDRYFGEEYTYDDLDLPEYTSVLWYSYIEECEFYYLSLADYWINDINVTEREYEELAGKIETHRDDWECGWNWGNAYFGNFTSGKRLMDNLILYPDK